jgi:hypothetical protein
MYFSFQRYVAFIISNNISNTNMCNKKNTLDNYRKIIETLHNELWTNLISA